ARVEAAVPTSSMIPFYRPIYIPRRLKGTAGNADVRAREVLASAATRSDPGNVAGVVGMCVVGRTLLGTSRLAWEAMKADRTVGKWVFVRWPADAHQYVELWQTLQQCKAKAVI